MQRYRFFYNQGNLKWYLTKPNAANTNPDKAALFTDADWEEWGKDDPYFQREEIGQDEAKRLLGSPMLPGLEV